MEENNEPKKSFSQKYISKYIALDVKTIIPLIVFIGSVSFGAYSAFTHETKAAITEIAKACDKNENEVIALKENYKALATMPDKMEQNKSEIVVLKEKYHGIDKLLQKMDRTLEKTQDLLIDHINRTKKSGH